VIYSVVSGIIPIQHVYQGSRTFVKR